MDTKKKIILGLFLLAVAGLGTVGAVSYRNKQKKEEEEAKRRLQGSPPPGQPAPSVKPSGSSKSTSLSACGMQGKWGINNDDFPLKKGSYGCRVKALQKYLNQVDSANRLADDGKFGPGTESAVGRELSRSGKPPVTQVSKTYYSDFISPQFGGMYNSFSGRAPSAYGPIYLEPEIHEFK